MKETSAGSNQRLHAIVHGRVQGVGFRANTLEQGRRLGVIGWVRNRHDGAVEVVAEAPREVLTDLLDYLKAGPPMANVTSVNADWDEARGEADGFVVRPTQ